MVQCGALAAFRETPAPTDVARLLGLLARTAGHVARERLTGNRPPRPGEVPSRIEAIDPAWLSHALGTTVTGIEFGRGSSGTSVRRQLLVQGQDGTTLRLFAKSTPTIRTRIANGATGVSASEAGFYTHLRQHVDLRAPVGHYSAFDPRSLRSIHLLEDLVITQQATFCTPTTVIDRRQAEQLVDTLAALHTAPRLRPILQATSRPPWLVTYARWWERGLTTASIKRYHEKAFRDAADGVIADPLRGKAKETWAAFVRSVEAHEQAPQPRQLIHNDVHLGNWYMDGNEDMGLCDWQCICIGHGTRDLAYALSTALDTEDRRAWERDLVARYADAAHADAHDTWDRYRTQLPGALLMWTPTHSPPRVLPDMQPRAVAEVMLRRITTAIVDLDAL